MGEFASKVHIENVRATEQTPYSLLCVIGSKEHWIPRAHIDDDSPVFALGHEGTLVISGWCAKERGLL